MTLRPATPEFIRLMRIAEAHTPQPGDGYCPECTIRYPCPTLVWATTNRTSTDPWDPNDDRVSQP